MEYKKSYLAFPNDAPSCHGKEVMAIDETAAATITVLLGGNVRVIAGTRE